MLTTLLLITTDMDLFALAITLFVTVAFLALAATAVPIIFSLRNSIGLKMNRGGKGFKIRNTPGSGGPSEEIGLNFVNIFILQPNGRTLET